MAAPAYAGIGNRALPDGVAEQLRALGIAMSALGWKLRTGGAVGADAAFMAGVYAGRQEVYRADDATEAAMAVAAQYHPAWGTRTERARRLLGRNAQIILGLGLDDPVAAVLAYAVNEERGGTALAIRIARAHAIPVVNLALVGVPSVAATPVPAVPVAAALPIHANTVTAAFTYESAMECLRLMQRQRTVAWSPR